MSAASLANELGNLASEAKRKNADLRTAAEKSLQDLKSLPATSEQQLSAGMFELIFPDTHLLIDKRSKPAAHVYRAFSDCLPHTKS